MKSAGLRLESFTAPRPAQQVTQADLDEAYHSGHERGLAEGREASLDGLIAEMARLRQSLTLLESREQQIRRETLASVAPALALIIDLLGPAGARERLLDKLQAELDRLAQGESRSRIGIRCPTDMRSDVQNCLRKAGLQAVVQDGTPDNPGIEVLANNGSIRLDPNRPAAELRAIIDELHIEE